MSDGYEDAAADIRKAMSEFRTEFRVVYRRSHWRVRRSHIFKTRPAVDKFLRGASWDPSLEVLAVEERAATRWRPWGRS